MRTKPYLDLGLDLGCSCRTWTLCCVAELKGLPHTLNAPTHARTNTRTYIHIIYTDVCSTVFLGRIVTQLNTIAHTRAHAHKDMARDQPASSKGVA